MYYFIYIMFVNFTVGYINNTLPNRINLSKWGLSSSSSHCSFCQMPLHIFAECNVYLNQSQHVTAIMSTGHAQIAVLSTKSLHATAFRSVESRL